MNPISDGLSFKATFYNVLCPVAERPMRPQHMQGVKVPSNRANPTKINDNSRQLDITAVHNY